MNKTTLESSEEAAIEKRINIIELAKEAGLTQTHSCCGVPDKFCTLDMWQGDLKAFAALVRAEALEEAEERVTELYTNMEFPFLPDITAAIRGIK